MRSTAKARLQMLMDMLNCFGPRRTDVPRPCDISSDASTYPSNRLYHTLPTTSRSSSALFPFIYSSIRVTYGHPFNPWAWCIRGRWSEETAEDGVRVCYGGWGRVSGISTPAADGYARFASSASFGDVVHRSFSEARELGLDDRHDDVSGWTGTTLNRRRIG